MTPIQILTFLEAEQKSGSMDSSIVLPDKHNIRSRAHYLRSSKKVFEINTYGDLSFFLERFMITDKMSYDNIACNCNDIMIVLDTFNVEFEDEHKQRRASLGFIFSNKILIEKLRNFAIAQGRNGLILHADGTAKLVVNNWILSIIGLQSVQRKSEKSANPSFYKGEESFTHTCLPFIFGLSRTEHGSVFSAMFRAYHKLLADFLLLPPEIKIVGTISDHSYAIYNACREAFGTNESNIWKHGNCYPHLVRNLHKHKGKFNLTDFSYEKVKTQIKICHLSPSYSIFKILIALMLQQWKNEGFVALSEWFEIEYCSKVWDGWWIGALNVFGSLPNNNSMESDNRTLKRYVRKRANLPTFIIDSIPRIFEIALGKWSQDSVLREPLDQVLEIVHKPLPTQLMLKAKLFIETSGTEDTPGSVGTFDFAINSIFFNADAAIDQHMTYTRAYIFHQTKYQSPVVLPKESVLNTFEAMIAGRFIFLTFTKPLTTELCTYF